MLPELTSPVFTHTLVGLGKAIKYRAFTNKEQKVLLHAKMEVENEKLTNEQRTQTMMNAVEQIIQACTFGAIDCKKLASFDLEDLFLRIRSRSVGEIQKLRYRFDFENDEGKPVSEFVDAVINFDEVAVLTGDDHTKRIILSEEPLVGIEMRYPTLNLMKGAAGEGDAALMCIDTIFDAENVWSADETPRAELEKFYDGIDSKGLLKIKHFFDTMPVLKHTVKIKTSKGEQTATLQGLSDFF